MHYISEQCNLASSKMYDRKSNRQAGWWWHL